MKSYISNCVPGNKGFTTQISLNDAESKAIATFAISGLFMSCAVLAAGVIFAVVDARDAIRDAKEKKEENKPKGYTYTNL